MVRNLPRPRLGRLERSSHSNCGASGWTNLDRTCLGRAAVRFRPHRLHRHSPHLMGGNRDVHCRGRTTRRAGSLASRSELSARAGGSGGRMAPAWPGRVARRFRAVQLRQWTGPAQRLAERAGGIARRSSRSDWKVNTELGLLRITLNFLRF